MGSKKIGSIKAVLANFDFSRKSSFKARFWDLGQKYLYFIEDSERPGQNPYKNALKSEVNGVEKFWHRYQKSGINCHFSRGKIAEKINSFCMAISIDLYLVEPH